MNKVIYFWGLVMLAMLPLSAQKQVTPLPVDSGYAFGQHYFFYALPQTAFQIDLNLNRVHSYRGKYADYAQNLLGLTNVITKDNISYELKGVSVRQTAVADTSHIYAVEPTSKQISSGLLKQLSMQRTVRGTNDLTVTRSVQPAQIPDFFRYYADLAYADKSIPVIETCLGDDGVVRQMPTTKTEKVAKTDLQQAQEAADQISKIRSDRYALIAGAAEVNYSAEAISEMVGQLNEMERNYMGLFTGFTVEDEIPCSFTFVPDSMIVGKQFVFAVTKEGVSFKKSLAEKENYYMVFTPCEAVDKIESFTAVQKQGKKYKDEAGYRIRQALPVEVTLWNGNVMMFSLGTVPMYQWGDIEILPLNQEDIDINKVGIIY